ncbi:hypothetical protein [Streptomyces sp. UG1]|uniref:hypothetical protein n=1 Tax=Streptomyces sp. UG1 TaxID=3417652 RepID=UPI003CF25E90
MQRPPGPPILQVNGRQATVSFPSTGSWTTPGTVSVAISLARGSSNTLTFSNSSPGHSSRAAASASATTPSPESGAGAVLPALRAVPVSALDGVSSRNRPYMR